jgi:hypothetical protein
MPIKKIPNSVNIQLVDSKNLLSFFTSSKKAHFSISEPKLFDSLQYCVRGINLNYQVHLTTYPNIAVHVLFGNAFPKDAAHINLIQSAIEKELTCWLKPI